MAYRIAPQLVAYVDVFRKCTTQVLGMDSSSDTAVQFTAAVYTKNRRLIPAELTL